MAPRPAQAPRTVGRLVHGLRGRPALAAQPSPCSAPAQHGWLSGLLNERVRMLFPTVAYATFRIQAHLPSIMPLSGTKHEVQQRVLLRQRLGTAKTTRHLTTSLLWLDPESSHSSSQTLQHPRLSLRYPQHFHFLLAKSKWHDVINIAKEHQSIEL